MAESLHTRALDRVGLAAPFASLRSEALLGEVARNGSERAPEPSTLEARGDASGAQRRMRSSRGGGSSEVAQVTKRAPDGLMAGARASFASVDVDEEAVQRCKSGDRAAFVALFRRHRADVVRLVHRMLGPQADVEDLVQEVFLQVHRSIQAFRGTSRFSTWLYRVTVNVVLMHRRAAHSRPRYSVDSEAPPAIDTRPLPDELVARNKRIRAFYALLDRLSEKKRMVFVLHEIEGLPPAEIAELVDAPVLTVRTRLFYARREVLALLQDEPELKLLCSEMLRHGTPRARVGSEESA